MKVMAVFFVFNEGNSQWYSMQFLLNYYAYFTLTLWQTSTVGTKLTQNELALCPVTYSDTILGGCVINDLTHLSVSSFRTFKAQDFLRNRFTLEEEYTKALFYVLVMFLKGGGRK
jgi:hypothetical protein